MEELKIALDSGSELLRLQQAEEERLLKANCDDRSDDEDCANIDLLLRRVSAFQENVLSERQKTDRLTKKLVKQMRIELANFEEYRVESEKLTHVNRLLMMRKELLIVRKEIENQRNWLETTKSVKENLDEVMKNREEAIGKNYVFSKCILNIFEKRGFKKAF